MPHSHPRPNPPYPYKPLSPHRPSLPSIVSSSLYLSPIQAQRILSWRTHATPPPITSSTAPAAPPAHTPALTHSGSPTTASSSSAARASAQSPLGPGVSVPDPRIKVKSAPASLVNPAGGSLCKACGGSCGCQSTVSVSVPYYSVAYEQSAERPSMGRIPSTTRTGGSGRTGSGSGTGMSRQRSYYSTKNYRQAKAMALRQQSGFGTGSGSGSGMSGQGDTRYTTQGQEPLPAHIQPEWGQPDGGMSERAAIQQRVQADPIVNPTPRIAGARDPVTQHYWRNMFPPAGNIAPGGIIPGMQVPMMGMGMGMGMPPNMMGMPFL